MVDKDHFYAKLNAMQKDKKKLNNIEKQKNRERHIKENDIENYIVDKALREKVKLYKKGYRKKLRVF